MSEFSKDSAEASISTGTYPDISHLAVGLYSRIQSELDTFASPLIDLGETALDIGSRDGRYLSAIRELGPRAVTAIAPCITDLQVGIDDGFVEQSQAFFGTAQEYLVTNPPQVDSVLLLNMHPALPSNGDFVEAVLGLVRPGGIVVSSCTERERRKRWIGATYSLRRLRVPERKPVVLPREAAIGPVDMGGSVHHFLDIGYRTEQLS